MQLRARRVRGRAKALESFGVGLGAAALATAFAKRPHSTPAASAQAAAFTALQEVVRQGRGLGVKVAGDSCKHLHVRGRGLAAKGAVGCVPGTAALGECRGRTCRSPHTKRQAVTGVSDATTVGFAIAALSSFFNGSFPVCQRLPSGPALDPVVFNGLVCLGVCLSSLLVPLVIGSPYLFTIGGMLGGILFVFAALFSFIAIPRAGLATAQAVWSCSAILVAFLWGSFGPAEVSAPVGNLPLSLVAVVLLVFGALVIVNADQLAQRFLGNASEDVGGGGEDSPEAPDRTGGILSALAVGVFGGSVLVPFKFVPPEAAGLLAVPSFGLGAGLAGLVVTSAYWILIKKESGAPPIQGDALLAGLASGFLWNAGNVCSIIAQSPPFSLSYGIAYPILQCALFFGGLWGIYVFKEIRGQAVNVFWAGALTLAAGIVALSRYGPGA